MGQEDLGQEDLGQEDLGQEDLGQEDVKHCLFSPHTGRSIPVVHDFLVHDFLVLHFLVLILLTRHNLLTRQVDREGGGGRKLLQRAISIASRRIYAAVRRPLQSQKRIHRARISWHH